MTESVPPLWSSPLDVDGLAVDAVRFAADSVASFAASRGIDVRFTASLRLIGPAFAAVDHLRIDGEAPEVWAPLSGFFEASDGFVRLHGNYVHHASAIRKAFPGARDATSTARAIGRLAAEEAVERVLAAGGIATLVRTEAQWLEHPHHRATAEVPWISSTPGGVARDTERETPDRERPLQGLRILDLTRVIAGPTCSQLLGCLGADVLRLDPPHRREDLAAFLSTGMGKRSAELDLRRDAADLHQRLIPQADVILLGYRPGALDRYGLSPEALASTHPGLVIGDLSAWGSTGPWGHRAGFDSIVQAATGIAEVCGDGRPGALPVQALDHSTGFRLAAAVLDLLAEDRGGVVRASLLGAARELLGRPRGRDASATDAVPSDPVILDLDSPHGRITAVPVPILVDGSPLSGPIGRYGAAEKRWSEDW